MDCSEFERRLLIDPESPDVAIAARQRVCTNAPSQLAEAMVFEHRLRAALQIDVPQDLVQRVCASLPAEAPAASSAPRWRAFALAASLMLTLAASFGLWMSQQSPTERLIQASVLHLAHEPFALSRTGRVPHTLVARMFTESGLRLDVAALDVSYLNRCPLDGQLSMHIVMPGKEGPVTVFFVPHAAAIERMDIHAAMVAVRTMPFASGALVMLAESNQDFDRIEDAWHGAADTDRVAAGGR